MTDTGPRAELLPTEKFAQVIDRMLSETLVYKDSNIVYLWPSNGVGMFWSDWKVVLDHLRRTPPPTQAETPSQYERHAQELAGALASREESARPSVANPLHEATEAAKRSLPILLRDGGSQHLQPTAAQGWTAEQVQDVLYKMSSGRDFWKGAQMALSALTAFADLLREREREEGK